MGLKCSFRLFRWRLGAESLVHAGNGLFICTIYNNNIQLVSGISVHIGSSFSQTSRLWEGPFICISCKNKDGVEDKLKPHLKSGLLAEGWFHFVLEISSKQFELTLFMIKQIVTWRTTSIVIWNLGISIYNLEK
jgi:hypothetical protein